MGKNKGKSPVSDESVRTPVIINFFYKAITGIISSFYYYPLQSISLLLIFIFVGNVIGWLYSSLIVVITFCISKVID